MSYRIALAFVASATLACSGVSSRPSPVRPRPSVLLVTFDTLRADLLAFDGDTRTKTPAFDALAGRSAVFERAFATAPYTPTSLWSLLYSLPIRRHTYTTSLPQTFPAAIPLAQRFKDQGYLTAAVVGSSHLNTGSGFERGFDVFLDTYSEPWLHNETTLTRVLELRKQRLTGRPWFVYVHFYDPHAPWGDAPPAYRTYPPEANAFSVLQRRLRLVYGDDPDTDIALRTYTGGVTPAVLKARGTFEKLLLPAYRSEITWSDDVLRRLLADFDSAGLLDDAIVAVSADHGICFAEHHQVTGYVFSLFNETLRVPLLLRAPGVGQARVRSPVSLLDLGPTLLDLAGIDSRHGEGRSFRNLLATDGGHRTVYAETTAMPADFTRLIVGDRNHRYAPGPENIQSALVRGRYKILFMPARTPEKFELYDIDADPQEKRNLFSAGDPLHRQLAQEVQRIRGEGALAKEAGEENLETLRALGYIR